MTSKAMKETIFPGNQKQISHSKFSQKEETAHALTHGLGIVMGLAALSTLVTSSAKQGDPWKIVSFAVYGASLVFLYAASTLYHSTRSQSKKAFFRKFDHAAIFVLIAGTYTPFALITLRGPWGWTIFGILWTMAIAGITLKLMFFGRWTALSVVFYLVMGWIGVIAMRELFATLSLGGLLWLFAGGLSYTIGVIFYAWKSLPYNHIIWHLFVLGGSISHLMGFYLHVLHS